MKTRISSLKALSFVLFFALAIASCQKAPEYPGKTWTIAEEAEDYGYDSEKLQKAEEYSQTIATAAVVIVKDGIIMDEWGQVERKFMTHSVRKSFLSAMYGNYVKDGTIDLDQTIAEAGITDEPPLTEKEKQATLRDCIKARSGIYHPALYESEGMKALKPERHSVRPGTHWYYNNWDFNAMGTVFEKFTGKKIFKALEKEIAQPIRMEDYTAEDGWYVTGEASIHPAYPFKITARDMARFGLLMLREGKWKNKQVVPADWVRESTRYHSDATLYGADGYGYMWWVARDHNKFPHLPNTDIPEGSYSARGAGGHYILVIPERNMVIVHRVNTYEDNSVSRQEFGKLVKMIFDAEIKD
jgi:CubicO group peptidase (beta-lactamase class C family)